VVTSHEGRNRALKVIRLLEVVPTPETRSQAARLAMTLAAFTSEQRARWAAFAGCRTPPSDTTWDWFVTAVRERAS
jgi:hypothetical protein